LLLLPHLVPDDGLWVFGVGGGEVFFLVVAGYLVAVLFNELVQALHGGSFFGIDSDVKNLGYGAVIPGLNVDLDAGDFLG